MHKILLLIVLLCSATIGYSQELQVSFPSDGLTLHGTLSVPSGPGPFPVVVFVHGSGPNDRDQTVRIAGGNFACLYPRLFNDTVRNFRDLAHAFQDYGIAVLRYDKRTFTYPTQLDPKEITPFDFITDVHAAVDYVKTRPEIDPTCLMLLGHSQGANFIPIVAKERDDISTLLALGTPSSGIDTILASQIRELYYRCLRDTARGDTDYNQTLRDFQKIRNGSWNPNTPYLGAYPKFWKDWINITDSAVINFNAVSQPTLFLHAMDDFNIPLADAQRYENRLTKDSFDVYYLDGLNHFFTTATDPTVSQVVPDTIFHWLQRNKLKTSVAAPIHQHHTLNIMHTATSVIVQMDRSKPLSHLYLLDIQGRVIDSYDTNGKDLIEISKGGYTSGMYLMVGVIDGHLITGKIAITN